MLVAFFVTNTSHSRTLKLCNTQLESIFSKQVKAGTPGSNFRILHTFIFKVPKTSLLHVGRVEEHLLVVNLRWDHIPVQLGNKNTTRGTGAGRMALPHDEAQQLFTQTLSLLHPAPQRRICPASASFLGGNFAGIVRLLTLTRSLRC